MPALQLVTGRVTNPGATITAVTANTGDSFAVRNFASGGAYLEQIWAQEATVGVARVRSPLLHDLAQAIRLRVQASARPLLPYETEQPLQAQDLLTVELSGGAAETDVIGMLFYYDQLLGVEARLATWEAIDPRILDVVGVELNMTTGGTAGQYGGSLALNANFDILQRNRDYALLGYLTDVGVGAVGFTGIDTGNLRVGGPGINDPDVTSDWFMQNARALGKPFIPIFNSANVGGITVDLVHTAAGAAVNVTAIMALLSGPGGTVGV